MLKRIRKPVSKKETLFLVSVLNRTSKFLTILAVFAMLWSYLPWQAIDAKSSDESNIQNEILDEEETDVDYYDSINIDPLEVPIDFEVLEDRTETSKTFRRLDGTYEVAMYDVPVHYMRNGEWVDIDNTLSDFGNELETKSNLFKVNFPKNLDDNKKIKVSYDGYDISWKVLDINKSQIEDTNNKNFKVDSEKELVNLNQRVLYRDIQSNVDLEYVVTGNQVKENIILNKYIENYSLSFEYKTTQLNIVQNEYGHIMFTDKLGNEIFNFSSLYMADSESSESNDVTYEIIKTGENTHIITIIPSDEWLKQASYPVVIDPTIVSTTQSISIFDTYVSEASPTSNYYSSSYMPVSNTSSSSEYRALLYFNLPSQVMDKVITHSSLTLTKSSKTTGRQINLYKNNVAFSSNSVTWNTKPSYDSRVVDYHIIDSSDKYIFDITKSVKEWQATGNTQTTGFTITDDEFYGVYNSVKQNSTSNAESIRPAISIVYEDPSGLKDYWTYTSQDMGLVGTGYITDYTGNLTWVRNEYSLDNEYMSLSLSFFHNNHTRSTNIGYGDGWRTNYNTQVLYDSYSSTYYMLKPDGNKVHFMNNSCVTVYANTQECTSIAEDGSRMILKRSTYMGENMNMNITTISDLKYNFDANGRLSSILNQKTSHYIRVYYISSTSQKIDYIKDEADNQIQFEYGSILHGTLYYGMKTSLHLKQTNGTLREVERNYYLFDGSYNINHIQRSYRYGTGVNTAWSTDTKLEYLFDSNNKLLNAYNTSDNYKIAYTYDSNNRVETVTTTDDGLSLGELDVDYELGKTTYTDYEGDSIYYLFDNYGHTVNVLDDYGNASFYKYSSLFEDARGYSYYNDNFSVIDSEPNYYNNHNLIESSDVMKQQHNPVVNHGFELGTHGWTLTENSGGTVDRDPNKYNIGSQSLYITSTSSSSYSYASQDVYLQAGNYTVSVWIDNPGSGTGAFIDVIGETTTVTPTKLVSTDGWEKVELSFYISYSKTVTIRLANQSISTAHFDNVHLFEGYSNTTCEDENPESCADYTNTRYNVVTNSSFESGNAGWTLDGASYGYIYESGIMQDMLGRKAMKIIGDGSTMKSAEHSLGNLYMNQETYIIAGWAKAEAVPNKSYLDYYSSEGAHGDNDGRFFGIELCYFDTNYPGEYCRYVTFNPDIEDWQFQMITVDLPSSALYLSLRVMYQGEGTAYFDNIQFYHDKLSTDYSYNPSTGDLEQVSSNGSTTEYGYDSQNNVTSITQDGITTDIDRKYTQQVEEVSRNNVRTTFEYNTSTGQIIHTKVGYNKDVSTQDKWFMTTTSRTSDGQYISSVKDEFGNTTYSTTNYSVGLISQVRDAIGNRQTFTYDEKGNLDTTIMYDATTGATIQPSISSSYEYDSQGRLWKMNREGYVYEFHYNNLDQVDWVKIAGTTVMSYDYLEEVEAGTTYYTDLLKKQTYGNNDYVEFTYTEENQVKTISFNGSVRFEYEYDSSGNLSVYKDIYNNNIYFYSYDLVGRLEQVVDKDSNTINYTYDSDGNMNGYDYSIGSVQRGIEYHYNQTTGVYDYTEYEVGSLTVTKDYDYDNDSLKRLDTVELVIGAYTFTKHYNYDDSDVNSSYGNATNRVGSISFNYNGSTSYHTYQYDKNHNITQIIVSDYASQDTDVYNYHYDGFNQLIREDIDLESTQYRRTFVYEYDSQGNITYVKEHYYTTAATVTTTQVSRKVFSYDNTWGDQLTNYSKYQGSTLVKDIDYDYDSSGNPVYELDGVSGATVEYQWDGRQMTGYYTQEGGDSYKYNDQGIRTKMGSNHNFVLDGDKVIVETIGSTTIYYSYDVDGSLLSMNYNGSEYFYITNMQGDVIELIDINGNSVAKYKYDAWGNILYQTGSMADENPYRYRGYRFDEDSGLYYLQSRYYNPETGRFISSKGTLSSSGSLISPNNYVYVKNNPITYLERSNLVHGSAKNGMPVLLNNENSTSVESYVSVSPSTVNAGYLAFKEYDSNYYGNLFVNSASKGTRGWIGSFFTFAADNCDDVFGKAFTKGLGKTFYGLLAIIEYGVSSEHYNSLNLTESEARTAKNLELGNIAVVTTTAIVAGVYGMKIGAAIGTAIFPGGGTVAGAVIGLAIGFFAAILVDKVYDEVVEEIYE